MQLTKIISITHEQMADLVERSLGNTKVEHINASTNALHIVINTLSDKLVCFNTCMSELALIGKAADIEQVQATMLG